MKIDLRTAVISADTRVWRLFPGSNYRFLPRYLETGTAFLDFPGLELPEPPLANNSELFGRMVLAIRNKERILKDGADTVLLSDWQDASKARRTKTRGRFLQALLNFYREAKAGDYIIVPSTLSDGKVHIGQFSSNSVTATTFARYGNHTVPARAVTWLQEVEENKLSTPLSRSLRAQHPFSLVEASNSIEVFSLANASLVRGDTYVATIANLKDDFLDLDASLLGNLSKLSAAACLAVDTGGHELSPATLLKVLVSSNAPIEYTCQQASDVHSKGFNRFLSAAKTPLVIVAALAFFLALPVNLTEAEYYVAVKDLVIENSLAPDDQTCAPPVSVATKLLLNAMDFDTAKRLCEAAHDAERRAGLSPSAISGE